MKILPKLLFRDKIGSNDDIDSFPLQNLIIMYVYCQNFQTFFLFLKNHFLGIHLSNKFLRNIMYVYQTIFFVDIASIVLHILSNKQIHVQYFSIIFVIYISILVRKFTGKSVEFLVIQISVNLSRFCFLYQP